MRKSNWLMAALLVVATALPACSEDETEIIYIVSFGSDKDILEGLPTNVKVRLNKGPSTRRYVTVKNDYTKNVEVSYGNQLDNNIVIAYDAGKSEQTVTVKGVKETGGQAVPIVFSIRDTNESQTLRVVVSKYIPPDGGLWPDTGPLEAGTKEAGTKEAGTKEAGASKEASTSDATSTH
jgi:hypothetical protein